VFPHPPFVTLKLLLLTVFTNNSLLLQGTRCLSRSELEAAVYESRNTKYETKYRVREGSWIVNRVCVLGFEYNALQ
jgi:hypothetical protein